ncbi:MAG: hypothetical protein RIG84_01165 [Roseovarius sp.]
MPLNQPVPSSSTSFVTLFDDTYDQPDCRAYYRMLKSLGYSNHAHAVPVFRGLLEDLVRLRGLSAPQVLDFASSYGIVSALVRHEVSAEAFLERYDAPALDGLTPREMAARDAAWLASLPQSHPGAGFTGIDVAGNAVAYGREIGLFESAFDEDLEQAEPSARLAARLAEIDLVIECGSVAHLMPAALERLLRATSGKRPWVVTSPVRGNERKAAFDLLRDHGYTVETLGLPPFPHRRFDSLSEQARAIDIARAAGHETSGFETTGHFFAQVYVARPPEEAAAA